LKNWWPAPKAWTPMPRPGNFCVKRWIFSPRMSCPHEIVFVIKAYSLPNIKPNGETWGSRLTNWTNTRVSRETGCYEVPSDEGASLFNSVFTAIPICSSMYGFLMYCPAPNLSAAFTLSVSENPLAITAFIPG